MRIVNGVLLWMLLLVPMPGFAQTASADAVSVPMTLERVGRHTYYLRGLSGSASSENQGFMSNAGFVVTEEGVVVFDTLGTLPLARRMLGLIRTVTDKPVARLIVSHYHADHYYGTAVFREAGAEVWAHRAGQGATRTEGAQARLEQRREVLFPWVNETQTLIEADRWIEGDTEFTLGGLRFLLRHVGPAHSAEDIAMHVVEDGVLFAGDLVFKGRVPFVGDADSLAWLAALDKLLALRPRVLIPGHGEASTDPEADLTLTRDYLLFLRSAMGKAVADFVPFAEAYTATDWSRYEKLPAFEAANRDNAYNTYLRMEGESLGK